MLMTAAFAVAIGSAFAFNATPAKLYSSNKNLFQQLSNPQSCPAIVCSDDNTRPHCIADLSKLYQGQNTTNPAICVTPELTFLYQRLP